MQVAFSQFEQKLTRCVDRKLECSTSIRPNVYLATLLEGAERIDSTVEGIETGEAHGAIVMIVMNVMLMTD